MNEITVYSKIIDFSELTGIEENKMRVRVIKKTYPKTWFRKKEKFTFRVEVNDPKYLSEDFLKLFPGEQLGNAQINDKIENLRKQEIWEAEEFINNEKLKLGE